MKWNLTNEPTDALVSVWVISSTAGLGSIQGDVDSRHGAPEPCSPDADTIKMLAARGERESVQLAIRPKMSWTSPGGISGSAGAVHVRCSDLFSRDSHGKSHPIRLAANQSITLRRVVPIFGIPDALVPLANTSSTHRQDPNYCPSPVPGVAADASIILGETTLLWLSIDVPSSQPCALYEGEVTVSALHTPVAPSPMPLPRSSRDLNRIPSTTPAPNFHDNDTEAMPRDVAATSTGYGKEAATDALVLHLDRISQSARMLSVVGSAESFNAVKTALMELLFLSPLFSDQGSIKSQDHHTTMKKSQDQSQQRQEEGGESEVPKQPHDFKPANCCVFISPTSSESASCEHRAKLVTMSKPIRIKLTLRIWNWSIPVTPSLPAVFGISEKVVEKEYGDLVHGSERWFKVLDMHYEWLLSYRVSPYFCRWNDDMSVLCYTCPWPADHPQADKCYSDPRLAAYAVPYKLPISEQRISTGQGMSSTPATALENQMSEGVSNIAGNIPVSQQTMSMSAELMPGKWCKSCSGHSDNEQSDDSVSCSTSNYFRERKALHRELLLLKERPHWKKSYFYLWDEPVTVDQYDLLQQRAEEIMTIAADARILTTYYCGPSGMDHLHLHQHPHHHHPGQVEEMPHPEHIGETCGETAPLRGTRDSAFENFLRVPDLMRPWTRIFCTSEWALGGCEDRAKQILGKLRRHEGEEWWTYVCMGPGSPHPNLHLGMSGTQHRAVMWRVWKEGSSGFLYWGANCYCDHDCESARERKGSEETEKAMRMEMEREREMDNRNTSAASSDSSLLSSDLAGRAGQTRHDYRARTWFRPELPPGDGVLFYPGHWFDPPSALPVASVRLERVLSGLQDYEYLELYSSMFGRAAAFDLIAHTGLYHRPDHYAMDHEGVDRMRSAVVQSCETQTCSTWR